MNKDIKRMVSGIASSYSEELISEGYIQLYNATLAVDLGDLKAGDSVQCLSLEFEEGKLKLYDMEEDEEYFACDIKISLA